MSLPGFDGWSNAWSSHASARSAAATGMRTLSMSRVGERVREVAEPKCAFTRSTRSCGTARMAAISSSFLCWPYAGLVGVETAQKVFSRASRPGAWSTTVRSTNWLGSARWSLRHEDVVAE